MTAVPASLAARPLDRAFDAHQAMVLHAWAGAGKTSTALEFARWYALADAAEGVAVHLIRASSDTGPAAGPGRDWDCVLGGWLVLMAASV